MFTNTKVVYTGFFLFVVFFTDNQGYLTSHFVFCRLQYELHPFLIYTHEVTIVLDSLPQPSKGPSHQVHSFSDTWNSCDGGGDSLEVPWASQCGPVERLMKYRHRKRKYIGENRISHGYHGRSHYSSQECSQILKVVESGPKTLSYT